MTHHFDHHDHHDRHERFEQSDRSLGSTRSNHHRDRRHGPHPMGGGDGFGRFGPGRRRRSKRGDVRAAVLLLLEEQPRNGYQLIQELEERSHGAWKPSPGSIYPVLSQLEDEGLVVVQSSDAGRTFELTTTGRALVAERREAFGQPWDAAAATVGEPRFELMRAMRQVLHAARQVMDAGSDDQILKVAEILKDSRRRIYGILAEEEP